MILHEKLALSSAVAVVTLGLFFFIKSRKRKHVVLSEERFVPPRALSALRLPTASSDKALQENGVRARMCLRAPTYALFT
jgi:hypothetical protein